MNAHDGLPPLTPGRDVTKKLLYGGQEKAIWRTPSVSFRLNRVIRPSFTRLG